MHDSAYLFSDAVIDRLVLEVNLKTDAGSMLVCIDHRCLTSIVADEALQALGARGRDNLGMNETVKVLSRASIKTMAGLLMSQVGDDGE